MPPPLVAWKPSRDVNVPRPRRVSVVPSLQSMARDLIVDNIEAVSSFGVLSPALQHEIAASLCALRKLRNEQLPLFAEEDITLTELIVPDCHLIEEPTMRRTLEPFANPASRIGVLRLGFCGRCVTPATVSLIGQLVSLHSLSLGGCYQMSDSALEELLKQRGAGLRSLHLSSNSQLSRRAVAAVAGECAELEILELENLMQLPAESLLPLRSLAGLQQLSLRGTLMLSDEVLAEVVLGSKDRLERLSLRDCPLLTDAGLISVVRPCSLLRDLDLTALELLTDLAVSTLGEALPALEVLSLRGCVQLSDAAITLLAESCKGSLRHLSLNKAPAIGDAAMVALRDNCASSLEWLDISWCRGVTDTALGSLVDSSTNLHTLTLFGCSQLTNLFYNGHSNDNLELIGRALCAGGA